MAVKTKPKKLQPTVRPPANVEPAPAIDYPKAAEKVMPGHYAIRVSAEAGSEVFLAVDGGNWEPCRYAAGHWWFDWNPSKRGTVTLSARARLNDGAWRKSNDVVCLIESH